MTCDRLAVATAGRAVPDARHAPGRVHAHRHADPGRRQSLPPRAERLNSSGIYELRGDRLVIVEPNDRRLLGFAWEVRGDGRLVLVDQPPVSKTGSNYLGGG